MTPMLGVEAAQELDLIQVRRENICMVKPRETNSRPLTKEQFIEKHPMVLSK